jgi:site-specific DNA-methyltransferase (adenine-specific)
MEIIGYQDKHEYTSPNGVNSFVYLMDCMEGMKQMDFKADLACVDPPYGINVNMNAGRKKDTKSQKRKYKKWDNETPKKEYWDLLFKTANNQIVFGANYMTDFLPIRAGWIFWDKCVAADCSFSDGELAWTSYNIALKKAVIPWSGFIGQEGEKFHPTTKPIALYDWIFKNYGKEGQTILDTHLGSQSSRIAAHKAGLTFIGFETDPDYFKQGCERFVDFVTAYEQEIGEEKVLKGQARLF